MENRLIFLYLFILRWGDGYLVTTIDINIQDVAENALLENLVLHNAKMGCAILMEVATGEIKAIANLKQNKQGIYEESYNVAIGNATEPGSNSPPDYVFHIDRPHCDLKAKTLHCRGSI